ncbi:MAG: hypothetical protein IT241_05805 [Bacteroidia bacterium]|nr:hypothetical protein [Bacteroidia bacterium]
MKRILNQVVVLVTITVFPYLAKGQEDVYQFDELSYDFIGLSLSGYFNRTYQDSGTIVLNDIEFKTERLRFFNPKYKSSFNSANRIGQEDFTRINYFVGSKATQGLNIMHDQKIFSGLRLTIDFETNSTQGYYLFQKSSFRKFKPELSKSFFNKVYSFNLGYQSYRSNEQENGGLADVQSFINGQNSDAKTAPVKMNGASFMNRDKKLYLTQRAGWSYIPDSTDLINYQDSILISNCIEYGSQSRKFQTDRFYSSLFENAYLDTLSTHDSIFQRDLYIQTEASVDLNGLLSMRTRSGKLRLSLVNTYQRLTVDQNHLVSESYYLTQLGPAVGFIKDQFRTTFLYLTVLSSSIDKGYFGEANMQYSTRRSLFQADVSIAASSAPLFYFHLLTNHYFWKRDFQLTRIQKAGASYQYKNNKMETGIAVVYQGSKNVWYLNSESEPEISNHGYRLLITALRFGYRLGGRFSLTANMRITDNTNENIIWLSSFTPAVKLIYSDSVFHSHALFYVSADISYVSGFRLPSFNPAIQEYYNGKHEQLSGFYKLDFTAGLDIQKAKIFLRTEHLNADWGPKTYFLVEDYPLPGRVIKLGVSWMLEH